MTTNKKPKVDVAKRPKRSIDLTHLPSSDEDVEEYILHEVGAAAAAVADEGDEEEGDEEAAPDNNEGDEEEADDDDGEAFQVLISYFFQS